MQSNSGIWEIQKRARTAFTRSDAIREKFGGDFIADESTFVMGIDHRLTDHIAQRFEGRIVLETCAGGGFSTIALARYAQRVISIEIESSRIEQARYNARLAQLADKITFICGDALSTQMDDELLRVNAAYLDPDWAVTGPGHVFRFFQSNTRPPTDALLEHVKRITNNIALILPPSLDLTELDGLPPHERERLFLKNEHALYCLYFGNLAALIAESDYKA